MKPPSDGGASMWSTSAAKSEISSEVTNGSLEMDLQHRTESSCSNSLCVNILPVSVSTSKEAYSFKHYGCSTDSSNSKASGHRISEEPLTATSESFISAQIRNVGIDSLSLNKNGDSLNQDNLNRSSKTEENSRLCDEHDNHSAERATSSEISGESNNTMPMEGKPIESKGESLENKSSMEEFVAGFDLNEDINANGMDDLIQPVLETISSHSVIHVVAKVGVPRGFPVIPLKFEGGFGWKGRAETSAFRRPNRKNISREFSRFDLNVAAEEDSPSNGFDLNCLCDELITTQASLPHESANLPLMDLNLNVNTSAGETSNDIHWLGRPIGTNNISNLVKQEIDSNAAYLADLSANLAHSQQYFVASQPLELMMQRVAPFNPNLPPQSNPQKTPFYFSSGIPVPSHYSGAYARYSHENGFFPKLINPSTVQASIGAPRLLQVAHGHNGNNIATCKPKVGGENNAREFSFPPKNSPMDEHMRSLQQEAWYATSTKRKEPEGGLEYFQLGYRQVT